MQAAAPNPRERREIERQIARDQPIEDALAADRPVSPFADICNAPVPLRYRGIPTYPSDAAFQLFSTCFTPTAPSGESRRSVFMDPSRSHEVTWLPAPDPPRRYIDPRSSACITIRGETIEKVTLADDRTGLPYTKAEGATFAPYNRWLNIEDHVVRLHDGPTTRELPRSPG